LVKIYSVVFLEDKAMRLLLERSFKLTGTIAWLLAAMLTIAFALTWISARATVQAAAPFVAWAFAICAILAIAIATIAFCVERSEWLATKRTELHRDRTLAKNEAKMANIASESAYMRMVAEAKLLGATLKQVENGLIHPAALGDGKFSSFPARVINQIEQAAVPLLEASPQPLLPAIANCDNVLIVGGKGSGKTTLLQHLEYERLQNGKTIILDSHAQPSQWAGQSIGIGRQYGMIKNAMIALTEKLNSRYQKFSTGQSDFEPIHTIIDEFTLLPRTLKDVDYNIQEYSIPALTEGRKVAINCLWGIHSDRAKALGLEGAMDLKECFDAIVYLKNVANDRYALIDFGEGKQGIHYTHPGPFTPAVQNDNVVLPVTTDATDVPPLTFVVGPDPDAPTPEEMAIIEAVKLIELDHGKIIWSKVTTHLGWVTSGANNQRIKAILDKWKISY
jgi:hypothetical protein